MHMCVCVIYKALLSVEMVTNKRNSLQMPYSSPKPKASRKGKKAKSTSAPATPSQPGAIFALNIWQYSMPNHTWSRRTAASPPPQGSGGTWPLTLCGCLAGEDVACIAIGREDDTCVWALDLHCTCWIPLQAESSGLLVNVSQLGPGQKSWEYYHRTLPYSPCPRSGRRCISWEMA